MELCSGDYALAMTSFMNREEDYDRLFSALQEIDTECQTKFNQKKIDKKEGIYEDSISIPGINASGFISRVYVPNEKAMEIGEATDLVKKAIPLIQAAGKISGDYVYLYPPGIPLLVPGEVITEEMIENIHECIKMGLDIKGIHKLRINVVN